MATYVTKTHLENFTEKLLTNDKSLYEELKSSLSSIGLTNKLKGHSWSVMGDSISHNDLYVTTQYWDCINSRVGGMTIHNYGISGQKITQFATRYSSMEYSDIITVFGGVNDWGQSSPTPIGTIDDGDTSTFYGALNVLCSGILSTFPKSLVIFITPLGNNGFTNFATGKNSLGLTIDDYGEAIINVCKKYKIPYVDGRRTKLNPDIAQLKQLYFHDGLHLNVLGHELLSYEIESEMLKHYIPNITGSTPTTSYTITNNLTNCTNSNSSLTIEAGASYSATITANSGYTLDSVTCTMGGVNQTVNDGVISISNVTGNIVVTANATQNGSSDSEYDSEGYRLLRDSDIQNIGGYEGITVDETGKLTATNASIFSALKLKDVSSVKFKLRPSLTSFKGLVWLYYKDNEDGTYNMLNLGGTTENGKKFHITVPGSSATGLDSLTIGSVDVSSNIKFEISGTTGSLYCNDSLIATIDDANMIGFGSQAAADVNPIALDVKVK